MKLLLHRFSFIAIVVAVMLATDGFAQPGAKILSSKNPVTVEIADQPGSPLNISLVSVDISDVQRQRVKLTIQNVSQNAIRGYVLSIASDGTTYLTLGAEEREEIDAETLVTKVSAFVRQNPEAPVLIGGDTSVDYGRVYETMVLLQQAGAPRVGLMSQPNPPPER